MEKRYEKSYTGENYIEMDAVVKIFWNGKRSAIIEVVIPDGGLLLDYKIPMKSLKSSGWLEDKDIKYLKGVE